MHIIATAPRIIDLDKSLEIKLSRLRHDSESAFDFFNSIPNLINLQTNVHHHSIFVSAELRYQPILSSPMGITFGNAASAIGVSGKTC